MGFFQKQQTGFSEEKVLNEVVSVPVSAILPNPAQPRQHFDDYALTQLAVSIQHSGILQPLTVRRTENGYELIAGERRLRAAKLVGIDYVPCIIIAMEDKDSALMAILENIQRAELNFIEEAAAIKRLIEYFELTQEEAATKLGIAQSTVANKLRLLRLPPEHRALALKFGLNERQTRATLRVPEEQREKVMHEIYFRQLNTMQTDRYVEEIIAQNAAPKPKITMKTDPVRLVGLYLNSFNKTVEAMRTAGINCQLQKNKSDDEIEYIVKIPLK